jgi:hypothetical protein
LNFWVLFRRDSISLTQAAILDAVNKTAVGQKSRFSEAELLEILKLMEQDSKILMDGELVYEV